MMRNGLGKLILAGSMMAAAVWAPTAAQAVPITFEFSGTVTITDHPGAAAIGDTFAGSFTYESTTPLYASFSAVTFRYDHAITNLNFTVGSVSGYSAPVSGIPPQAFTEVSNGLSGDAFQIWQTVAGTSVNGFSPVLFEFALVDRSGSMFSSGALPTSLMIPESTRVRIFMREDSTGIINSQIFSSVTSLTRVSSVPEPSNLLLLGAGLAGFALWRRKLVA